MSPLCHRACRHHCAHIHSQSPPLHVTPRPCSQSGSDSNSHSNSSRPLHFPITSFIFSLFFSFPVPHIFFMFSLLKQSKVIKKGNRNKIFISQNHPVSEIHNLEDLAVPVKPVIQGFFHQFPYQTSSFSLVSLTDTTLQVHSGALENMPIS